MSHKVKCFMSDSGVCFQGSEQSKQIIFAPSVQPTFVNVPQNNFVEPFVLNPGMWTVVIEAEGILLVRHTKHLLVYYMHTHGSLILVVQRAKGQMCCYVKSRK